jgi:hypothetical protein
MAGAVDRETVSNDAIYLYCLVRSAKAPSLTGVPKGIPGAGKPRALEVAPSLWALIANAPLKTYGEEQIAAGLKDLDWVSEIAVSHEAVVEFGAKKGAVVPAKLFTIFLGEPRLKAWAEKDRTTILRILKRVDGHEEWAVRISLDERAALAAAEKRARQKGPATSGAGFLARKKELRDATRVITTDARANVDALHDQLSSKASDARRRAPLQGVQAGPRLLLDAAYLVPVKKAAAFRKAVDAVRKKLGAANGYDVHLTGPWPPYNFVADAA